MNEYQSQDVTALAKALFQVQRQLQPALKDAENPFMVISLNIVFRARLAI